MITLKDIGYAFGQEYVLEHVTLSIPNNALLAIVGPNGGGKSTLLKIISGLLSPTQGSVDVKTSSVGYLPQRFDFDRHFPLTVYDVISMGFWATSRPWQRLRSEQKDKIHTVLKKLQLESHRLKNLSELSGGEFQRVLFGRLILQDTDLMLLDEPFSAIDEGSLEILMETIQGLHQNKTIIIVIHQYSVVRRFFPLTLLLSKHVLAYGNTKEVLLKTFE